MTDFVYPCNFIRPGKPSERRKPKTHAMFSGLSGTIHCKLTTDTPIFTPDPATNTPALADSDGVPKGHRVLEFFHYDFGEAGYLPYAIPGTSLKGMIRSVGEALSNSCWSQFDGERVRANRPLPEWWNRREDDQASTPQRRVDRDGKVLADWWPDDGLKRRPGRILAGENGSIFIQEMQEAWLPLADTDGYQDRDPIAVRVSERTHRRAFRYLHCEECHPGHRTATGWRNGYVKIVEDRTNQGPDGTDGRHYQRAFLEQQHARSVVIPRDRVTDLQDRWNRACWGPHEKDDKEHKLEIHDLVWFTLDRHGELDSIGPVSLYKRRPRRSRDYALKCLAVAQTRAAAPSVPDQEMQDTYAHWLEPCHRTDELCFCCRLFGMVRDEQATGRRHHPVTEQDRRDGVGGAMAGRVSFGFARATVAVPMTPLPLRVLGGPKPKFAPFYLAERRDPQDPAGDWEDDRPVLRGRKFYWHHQDHGGAPTYYEQKNSDGCPSGRSDQNATVTALGVGATFEFEVDFWDLSEKEVGCLLMALSLQLDDAETTALRHKFGMGKPVGFGSCAITVTRLEIIATRGERYRSANLFGEADLMRNAACGRYLSEFRAHLEGEAGIPFTQLPQIADASIMWGLKPEALTPALPVRYNPDPDGAAFFDKGFEYFTKDWYPRERLRGLAETSQGIGQPSQPPPPRARARRPGGPPNRGGGRGGQFRGRGGR